VADRTATLRGAGPGERLASVAGLVLLLSSFTGWYSGEGPGATYSIMGWHTGTLGKLVFFAGLGVLVLLLLRATGLDLPPSFPVGAAVASVGALGTIFVLVRLIDIPETFAGASRAIGLWISLASALSVVAAGLYQAAHEGHRPPVPEARAAPRHEPR
jgi:hypothetical protein